MNWLVTLLASSAVGGIVAAVVSALLARRTFVTQRWWELQAEAYRAVLEAIAGILSALADMHEEISEPGEIDPEFFERAKARWIEAGDRATAVIGQGTFLISEDAHAALTPIHDAHMRDVDESVLGAWLENYARAVGQARDAFLQIAKRDLRVGKVAPRPR